MEHVRHNYLQTLSSALEGQRIIWFGTRGCDAKPLMELPQFGDVFSIISPLNDWPGIGGQCLETLTGRRVDLDAYSVDDKPSNSVEKKAVCELWQLLSKAVDQRCVLVPYRPYNVLTSVIFPRENHAQFAGLFQERQNAFEHKVWVETELKKERDKIQVPINFIDWKYFLITDSSRPMLEEMLNNGSLVVRLNRSTGGNGLFLVENENGLNKIWDKLENNRDGYCSVAPYIHDSIPISINGCVFSGQSSNTSEVRLHGPSIQIVGDPALTRNPFSYCGNDFGLIKRIEPELLGELDLLGRFVGNWLYKERYIGAFGIDALIYENKLYLVEVNPRFQGSSSVAALLDQQIGQPDLYIEHISAYLGLCPPPDRHVCQLVEEQPEMSHVVIRNLEKNPVEPKINLEVGREFNGILSVLPPSGIKVDPNAIICRFQTNESVSKLDGKLTLEYQDKIQKIKSIF